MSTRPPNLDLNLRIVAGFVLVTAVWITGCGGADSVTSTDALAPERQSASVPEWLDQWVTPEPTPTSAPPSPSPTAVPTAEPTRPPATATPVPTATAEPSPTAEPTPTPTPTPEPDEPTSVPPTVESIPDKVLPPSDYRGDLLALRTDAGVMLTVRSVGPNYEVVTPCFNITQVQRGQPITGPVDILIDPGHGGPETGAVGPNGLVEADLNLVVSALLNDRLTASGYSVQQTRYSDHYVAIQARAELANALAPRVFISVHHNGGFPDPSDVPGTEIFVQKGDGEAQRLGGLVFEEIQREFADIDAAWVATDAFGVSWRSNRSGTDLYGVLRRTPDLVSVLIEPMYLNSAAEAQLLAQPAIQQREADAIARAIERFFGTEDPGSGFIDGLVFQGDLGPGGGTDGCVDPVLN